jgi:CheY-like chemotaxis protein
VTSLAGKRILVVEDEPTVAMMIEDMLEDLGCRVVGPALRITEALEFARSERIDAAMLDVNMGGGTSLEVARALAERSIPFLFATGYGASGAPDEWPDVVVVQKPYTEAGLIEALTRCVRS